MLENISKHNLYPLVFWDYFQSKILFGKIFVIFRCTAFLANYFLFQPDIYVRLEASALQLIAVFRLHLYDVTFNTPFH